jgi:hypothetical protein
MIFLIRLSGRRQSTGGFEDIVAGPSLHRRRSPKRRGTACCALVGAGAGGGARGPNQNRDRWRPAPGSIVVGRRNVGARHAVPLARGRAGAPAVPIRTGTVATGPSLHRRRSPKRRGTACRALGAGAGGGARGPNQNRGRWRPAPASIVVGRRNVGARHAVPLARGGRRRPRSQSEPGPVATGPSLHRCRSPKCRGTACRALAGLR